jgi:hypothetical protein
MDEKALQKLEEAVYKSLKNKEVPPKRKHERSMSLFAIFRCAVGLGFSCVIPHLAAACCDPDTNAHQFLDYFAFRHYSGVMGRARSKRNFHGDLQEAPQGVVSVEVTYCHSQGSS